MVKPFSVVSLFLVVITATVVVTRHSDNIFASFTSWTDSSAKVPGLIPFQAVLTDSVGSLVEEADYTVTFVFCSSATGDTSLWLKTKLVMITDVLLSTHLAVSNPITSSAIPIDELLLDLTVGCDV